MNKKSYFFQLLLFIFFFGCTSISKIKEQNKNDRLKNNQYIMSTQEALIIIRKRKLGRSLASGGDLEIPYYTDQLRVCSELPTTNYRSKNYPSWFDEDDACKDPRQFILRREHLSYIKLHTDEENSCAVTKGKWKDYFSSRAYLKYFNKDMVQLTIPFEQVHISGGYNWSEQKKKAFLYSFNDPEHHLISTRKSYNNRKKYYPGQSRTGKEFPKHKARRCEYVGAWIKIKKKWDLCASSEEIASLKQLENECRNSYDRGHWKHWVDHDKNCMDARQEALLKDAYSISSFERERSGNECKVHGGSWTPVYLQGLNNTNQSTNLTDPKEVDVDHFVPLKNAHVHGGWAWSARKKEKYANFLEHPYHLLSVSAGQNRSKGAKGPEDYMPPNQAFGCDYIKIWIQIKDQWNLFMNQKEILFIEDYLNSQCREDDVPIQG
jgi:hypothetical protein